MPRETPGDADGGMWVHSGYGILGLYSGHDTQFDAEVPDGATLYAPTMVPPESSYGYVGCLETTTVHYNPPGFLATGDYAGVYNLCTGGFAVYKNMNDNNFIVNYVRQFDGENRYFTKAEKSSGTWRAYFYNFAYSRWDEQYAYTGNGYYNGSPGWTMFETYFSGQCPNLPRIRSAPVQYFNGSTWANLVSPYGSQFSYGNCFTNGSYWIHVHQSLYDWEAHTP